MDKRLLIANSYTVPLRTFSQLNTLHIAHGKRLHSDWVREMQFQGKTIQKRGKK